MVLHVSILGGRTRQSNAFQSSAPHYESRRQSIAPRLNPRLHDMTKHDIPARSSTATQFITLLGGMSHQNITRRHDRSGRFATFRCTTRIQPRTRHHNPRLDVKTVQVKTPHHSTSKQCKSIQVSTTAQDSSIQRSSSGKSLIFLEDGAEVGGLHSFRHQLFVRHLQF